MYVVGLACEKKSMLKVFSAYMELEKNANTIMERK